eukprot:6245317-Amphidinium_carterae.1
MSLPRSISQPSLPLIKMQKFYLVVLSRSNASRKPCTSISSCACEDTHPPPQWPMRNSFQQRSLLALLLEPSRTIG